MRRLLLLLLLAGVAEGQARRLDREAVRLDGARMYLPGSTTLPATCTVQDVYIDTDQPLGAGLYVCGPADTWTNVTSGAAIGTGTSGQFALWSGTSTVTGSTSIAYDTGANTNPLVKFTSKQADSVPHVVKGYAGQTANLTNWTNSSDAVLAYVNATGAGFFSGGASGGTRAMLLSSMYAAGRALGAYSTAVGPYAVADAEGCVTVGGSQYAANCGSQYGVLVAPTGSVFGVGGVAIGVSSAVGLADDYSLAMIGGQTTDAHQVVVGGPIALAGANSYITDVYFGSGVTDTAPKSVTYHATGGSGTDVAGASYTIEAGRGTGTGAGGSFGVQGAYPAASTGSSANTPTDRLSIPSKWTTLTESTPTAIATLTYGASTSVAAEFFVTVKSNDGTEYQSYGAKVMVVSVRKATGNTVSAFSATDLPSTTSGTLSCSYTITEGASAATLNASCTSSLTQTTLAATWQGTANGPVILAQN